jgi:hypothetical protein
MICWRDLLGTPDLIVANNAELSKYKSDATS